MKLLEDTVPDTSLMFEPGAWHRAKPSVPPDLPKLWRSIAEDKGMSAEARIRLEWMLYDRAHPGNVVALCRHFGISRQAFYTWKPLFNASGVEALETRSRAPKATRQWEVTGREEYRIKALRRAHMHWGKQKLKVLYLREYGEEISAWKIERVIRRYSLFPRPEDVRKLCVKKRQAATRQRLHTLSAELIPWWLIHLDTIVIYWGSEKCYVLTAEDHHTRIAYARMYTTKSSRSAADFLRRLHCLIDHDVTHVHTDNGSEFAAEFDRALTQLGATHWYSRSHTPKDNARLEKFNGTLQYEWLNDGHFTPVVRDFNRGLTDFLEEYNFVRPHQALAYLTPFEYLEANQKKRECHRCAPPVQLID